MKAKIIIWILMILITVYGASALVTDGLIEVWEMDNATSTAGTSIGSLGNYNLTNTGADIGKPCLINECYDYVLANTDDLKNTAFAQPGEYTFTFWVWGRDLTSDRWVYGFNTVPQISYNNVNTAWRHAVKAGVVADVTETRAKADQEWHLIITRRKGNTRINTIYNTTGLVGNSSIVEINGYDTNDLYIGQNGAGAGKYWDGYIDQVAVWNRSLNDTEIAIIWNSGKGNPYTNWTAPPGPGGMNITVSYTTPVYEESAVIHTLLIKDANITNQTTANLRYNGIVYPGVINWTNSSYVFFTVNLNMPFVYLNNTAIPFNWTYHLRMTNGTNYTNITINYNQYVLWNLTKYPRINISAFAIAGGAAILNFTLNNTERNLSTTTGSIYFWTNGTKTLNITIDAPGYAITWALINFTSGSFGAYNFSLYTTNSIMFYFRDEATGNLVNNVSIELISNIFASNYSTTNGTLYVDLLSPETYIIRYNSVGYFEKFYYFTLINRTFNNLTLYLLSNTTGSEVMATVFDESNFVVENAYIKVLKYNIFLNQYVLVEIAKTNFEGQAQLHLELNDEFYQFIIEYPFGIVRKITSPTYIYELTLTFQIIIESEVGERFYKSQDITYDLTFNNATNNFRLIYSDSNNVLSKMCLKIWRISALERTLYNNTCLTSPSGTILLGVANVSGTTYEAQAFGYFSEPGYYLTSLTHTFEVAAIAGLYGLFLILILTIVFVCIGWWSASLALILTPIPMMLGSILNIIDMPIGLCISIEIVCVIIAYWISRRN